MDYSESEWIFNRFISLIDKWRFLGYWSKGFKGKFFELNVIN